jgi:hypothetical protein
MRNLWRGMDHIVSGKNKKQEKEIRKPYGTKRYIWETIIIQGETERTAPERIIL